MRLVLRLHPDKSGTDATAPQFRAVQEAYEALTSGDGPAATTRGFSARRRASGVPPSKRGPPPRPQGGCGPRRQAKVEEILRERARRAKAERERRARERAEKERREREERERREMEAAVAQMICEESLAVWKAERRKRKGIEQSERPAKRQRMA